MKQVRTKKSAKMTFRGVMLFLIVLFVCPAPHAVFAQNLQLNAVDGNAPFRISGHVYYGDKNHFQNPCVLQREKVFKEIPAYKKIVREKLDKNSARYYFLLEEANRTFRTKVKEIASQLGYDLVVEKGGIKGEKRTRFNDISGEVIKAL